MSSFRRILNEYVRQSLAYRRARQRHAADFLGQSRPHVRSYFRHLPSHDHTARRVSLLFSEAVVALRTEEVPDPGVEEVLRRLGPVAPALQHAVETMVIEAEALRIAQRYVTVDGGLNAFKRDTLLEMWRVDIEVDARHQLETAGADEAQTVGLLYLYREVLSFPTDETPAA